MIYKSTMMQKKNIFPDAPENFDDFCFLCLSQNSFYSLFNVQRFIPHQPFATCSGWKAVQNNKITPYKWLMDYAI